MECDDDDHELRNTASSPIIPTEASETLQSSDLDTKLADELAVNCEDTVTMTTYCEADLSVDMECDDDDCELLNTASSPIIPTNASEMLQSSDLDTELAVGENDCNDNVLCHACGCVGGCQCFHPQTADLVCTGVDCNDLYTTVSLSVLPTRAVGESSQILSYSNVDIELGNIGDTDHGNNTSCHVCGCIRGCQCLHPDTDDHNYAASVRPTVRTHKRTGVKLTRKRTRNYSQWKSVKRKRLRQEGKVYVMSSGATATAKVVKSCTRDHDECRFKCAGVFDDVTRQTINEQHWCMTDDEKRQFYLTTTKRSKKARTRRADDCNRKKMSYEYYFYHPDEGRVRVCKEFYFKTLHIDSKRVINAHKTKNLVTGTPRPYVRGKHTKKRSSQRDHIRRHIESIPTVDSHYCRKDSNKTYLDGRMNLQILYEKYVDECTQNGEVPAKIHLYREVFNHEYNIAFIKPKKDRCDMCESAKVGIDLSAEQQTKFAAHMRGKTETHTERAKDRNSDHNQCTVCFDMQNVFALPLANVSNFFYKRKLNVYHLTAHCSLSKQSYGALWPETMSGRSGNDIASALVCLLERLVNDHPDQLEEVVLWSDSCVPQNRNKIMTSAIMLFLQSHPSIKVITQKFCEPGHSDIQEVDNVHSQLEKALQTSEVYSPLGLVRILCKVPRKKPLKLTQLKKEDIREYRGEAENFRFECIPFSKVKALQYASEHPMTVRYKLSFADDWTETIIQPARLSRHRNITLKTPAVSKEQQIVSKEKLKDLESMLVFMPAIDREYMQTVITSGKPKPDKKNTSGEHDDSDTEPNNGAGAAAGALVTKKILSGVENVAKGKRKRQKTALKQIEEKKSRLNIVTSKQSTYNTRSAKASKNIYD